MTKNKVSTAVLLILTLLSVSILAACQTAGPKAVLAAEPEDEIGAPGGEFDYEQAAEVSAFRWQAMADGYAKLGLLNLDAGDISAFRWNAMAKGYEKLGMRNTCFEKSYL